MCWNLSLPQHRCTEVGALEEDDVEYINVICVPSLHLIAWFLISLLHFPLKDLWFHRSISRRHNLCQLAVHGEGRSARSGILHT